MAKPSLTRDVLEYLGKQLYLPTDAPGLKSEDSLIRRAAASVLSGFHGTTNTDEDVLGLVAQKIPRIDPASGKWLSNEERRRIDVAKLGAKAKKYSLAEADKVPGLETVGAAIKDFVAPSNLLLTGATSGATLFEKPLVAATTGGLYEGAQEYARQQRREGSITDPSSIARKSLVGAIAAPAGDAALNWNGTLDQAVFRSGTSSVLEQLDPGSPGTISNSFIPGGGIARLARPPIAAPLKEKKDLPFVLDKTKYGAL